MRMTGKCIIFIKRGNQKVLDARRPYMSILPLYFIREPFSVFIIWGWSGQILILYKFEVEDIEISRFKFLSNFEYRQCL